MKTKKSMFDPRYIFVFEIFPVWQNKCSSLKCPEKYYKPKKYFQRKDDFLTGLLAENLNLPLFEQNFSKNIKFTDFWALFPIFTPFWLFLTKCYAFLPHF